jgi:WW domain-binding protein 2
VRRPQIVYLPARPTAALESFAAPIMHCADAHVAAPFFGPNVWTATVAPVPGGNVPADCSRLAVRMTFKDGGAYDFHSTFERVKERTVQAVETAGESGRLGAASAGLDAVHLDELPAYEHAAAEAAAPLLAGERGLGVRSGAVAHAVVPPAQPPTYEDVQLETVTNEMESRMRLQG